MIEQQRSKTFRKGSPESHEKAVHFVADFLNLNWDRIFLSLPSIYAPFRLVFTEKFIQENKLQYRIHEYDLAATFPDRIPIAIVEIGAVGDDSKHNAAHKQQLINDGIAKKFIEEYYPYCKFYRLNKDDCMLEPFLRKTFFKYGDRYEDRDNKKR
jgi:hypothetical protein